MRSQNPVIFVICATFFSCPFYASALTYEKQAVKAALAKAPLVADVEVLNVEKKKDPVYGIKFKAQAKLLNVIRDQRTGTYAGDHTVTIEGIGGELGEVGVYLTGYPRPVAGKRYRAFLTPSSDGYSIVGFENGFAPLGGASASRSYTRNRTDGSNGDGNGPFIFWDTAYFPIPYYFSAPSFRNFPDYVVAIDKSLNTWRSVEGTNFEFLPMGCTNSTTSANDGLNQIVFVSRGWDLDPLAIAVTRNYYISGSSPRTGMILDSDILINGQTYRFSTTNQPSTHDVQNIITHEVGHVLGLGHEISPEDNESTMYAFAAPNEFNKTNLHVNDLEGVKEGYSGAGNRIPGPISSTACLLGTPGTCLAVHSDAKPTPWTLVSLVIFLTMALAGGRQLMRQERLT